jgi:hypothetical protein
LMRPSVVWRKKLVRLTKWRYMCIATQRISEEYLCAA